MPANLFISYSHRDEDYRNALVSHLALMKKNGVIKDWHDRKILPGKNWRQEIDENLEKSDIVLLLISSDFINSDYCYNYEAQYAMERHNNGNCVVVPIFIRHCDWKDAPFAALQGLPENAKPIKSSVDQDEAWTNVANGLKKIIEDFSYKKVIAVTQSDDILKKITEAQKAWLEDTEVEFTHRKVKKVLLPTIYVPPHLKVLSTDLDELVQVDSTDAIFKSDSHIFIYGDEQSGKTSLTKYLFSQFLKSGHFPLALAGKDINSTNIDQIISDNFYKQYDDLLFSTFSISPASVLIVDDFQEAKLSKKFRNEFLKKAKGKFCKCIFLAQESYQYVAAEHEELSDIQSFEIMYFGNIKRSELVEKWVSLGIEEEIEEGDLYKEVDDIKLRLNSMIRGNVVPSKPIYILTILQMFEAYNKQNLDLTSYGHCYQHLVYQALENAKIRRTDYDKYLNILTELAWAIYKNEGGLPDFLLKRFFREYEGNYVLEARWSDVIENLSSHGIITFRDEKLSFKYPYIYYFFVAKKIAEAFHRDGEIKSEIQTLLNHLHKEDCANIIIFISHHTKDSWILDEIQLCLMDLFQDQEEATLSRESLAFMQDFIEEIPDLVLEKKVISEERKKHDEVIDDLEFSEKQKNDNLLEPNDILAKINKVFKGIEIVGQIVRNRHASLHRDLLLQMVEFSTHTGLRFLQFFIEISDVSRDEVIKTIEHILQENPTAHIQDIEKEAKSTFLYLTYGVIYGVLRKISASIGSKEAYEIYEQLEEKIPTPAIQLINQAINLQFKKHLDFNRLSRLTAEYKTNPTCSRILKEIVVQHTYMFPVEYKDMQKICSSLGLTMRGQRLVKLQKRTKL